MTSAAQWVLVADASRARIFEVDRKKRALKKTPKYELNSDAAPSREIATDKPGRTMDRFGDGRHAKEPSTDPHRFEKWRFAQQISSLLEKARARNAYGQLYLVAPPQMLGDLREILSGPVRKHVEAEIAKDLAKMDADDLEKYLRPVFRPWESD